MAHSKHIDKVLDRYSDETIANNRLRLKISIDAIRWLAFQACAFRGDDESPGSLNRGNFIELIKLLTLCNQNVNNVVLENAPGNAQYISPCPKKFAMFINSFQLTLIVNVVTVSPKRHDLLRVAQANNVANLNADDQLVTGSGLNQIGTLQRAGDTRWGSHLNSVRSLLCMFDATCEVLKKSTEEGNFSTRGDASAAYDAITSFEFVFVLHLMRNILEKRRTCKIVDQISVENHYRVNLFLAVIDTQLQELNGRFNDHMVELLTLSSTLDPRDNYKFFSVNKVCELVERFYPGDFSDQEKFHIRMQAQHYELDIPNHVELTNLCTISELCQGLTKTGKSLTYPLIDHLICLVLTLPVSTATTERSFSAMNIVKNRLKNKMEDEFLANCLLIYIEKKITERFDTDSIIDEFYDMKNRRVPLR
ncbi:uncharacterized protein LOC107459420 [Arachis duranensis]|uniref:Uncharacterized protein LOC107459420 n=1 Tax=Arachis duranensis TaxID=130453 RepID=A0A6P4B344_ARADU|nr:uncharacterized protein LOC107459420 [Arachis duranensis]